MNFMLDTDTCIFLMKGEYPQAARKFRSHASGRIGVSVISVCELQSGVEKSRRTRENQEVLDAFLRDLEVSPFQIEAVAHFAKIRAGLGRKGRPIGDLDALIAAHALQLGTCLVTHNTREFSRVPGLRTENWIGA